MLSLFLISAEVLSAFTAELHVDKLRMPPGFEVGLFGQVENARQMALGDIGTVFVGCRAAGKVHALVDDNGDYKADRVYLIADDLNMPSVIAYNDGDLYVAAVNRVIRYDNIESHLYDPPGPVVITATLPDDTHHGWKYIAFGPAGDTYVPVGVHGNSCPSSDIRHGLCISNKQAHGSVLCNFCNSGCCFR